MEGREMIPEKLQPTQIWVYVLTIIVLVIILTTSFDSCQAKAQSSYGETEMIERSLEKINTNLDRIADALEEHNRREQFKK